MSGKKRTENYGKPSWLDYPWPPLTTNSTLPLWTGNGFKLGNRIEPILRYEVGISGWSDELTFLHEETAGADHPIDRASRNHVIQQLKKYMPCPFPVILEIGCSSGFMLRQIRKEMPHVLLMGADYLASPLLKLANQLPSIPLLQFDLTRCPLPDATIDVVILLNVLEHIADDQIALAHVSRILKPGGIAIIEVPAGPNLYDVYDHVLKHQRRYSISDLKMLVKKVNLEILYSSHLGFFLYPAFWWVKRRNQKRMNESYATQHQVVQKNISETKNNPWVEGAVKIEQRLGKFIPYPWGIRCMLTARKPFFANRSQTYPN